MKARPLNHSFVIGGIRLNHLRLATVFLILTVLAALHTSIFGGGYTTDNIYVATTINTSIKTSADDEVNDDGDGKEPPVLSSLIHRQNDTAAGEPYVNRWQRRFSDSENR